MKKKLLNSSAISPVEPQAETASILSCPDNLAYIRLIVEDDPLLESLPQLLQIDIKNNTVYVLCLGDGNPTYISYNKDRLIGNAEKEGKVLLSVH